MREFRTYGSVRGAVSNDRPYRDSLFEDEPAFKTPDPFILVRFFMDDELSFQTGYGHLFAGAYIEQNLGTSTDQDWAYAQLWVKF